jgi:hypothetical protein
VFCARATTVIARAEITKDMIGSLQGMALLLWITCKTISGRNPDNLNDT